MSEEPGVWVIVQWAPSDMETYEVIHTCPINSWAEDGNGGIPEWCFEKNCITEFAYYPRTGLVEWVPAIGPAPIYTKYIEPNLDPASILPLFVGEFKTWIDETY